MNLRINFLIFKLTFIIFHNVCFIYNFTGCILFFHTLFSSSFGESESYSSSSVANVEFFLLNSSPNPIKAFSINSWSMFSWSTYSILRAYLLPLEASALLYWEALIKFSMYALLVSTLFIYPSIFIFFCIVKVLIVLLLLLLLIFRRFYNNWDELHSIIHDLL
jgi:hypothetical protein